MNPTKYDIRLLRVAEDDLTEIILYVASDRPNAATRLAGRFEQRLLRLATNPFLGAVPGEGTLARLGYRYLLVDNYIIFYVVEAHIIYVHRIVHGARDYTQLL